MKKHLSTTIILSSLLFTSIGFSQIASTEQDFVDIEDIPGWTLSNQSVPLGRTGWFQGAGVATVMLAQDGEPDSFIAANYENTADDTGAPGTICNYLIMPDLGNLETVSFYTRSRFANNNFNVYPDRLYMIYSPTGEINPGNCTDGFGDFSETLLVINPDLTQEITAPEGYPLSAWEQFSSEINGDGRIAFVYYVEDAGLNGTNANYIGIDTVEWTLAPFLEQAIFTTGFE